MDSEKILKYVIYSGLFIVPFVPLYVAGSLFFPFITGKAFLFRIVVEIIFGSWLILAIKNNYYRPQKSWLLYALSLFVGIIALADIFSGHFLKSFWSNFERMEGLIALLHLLAYFFVLVSFIKTDRVWDNLLKTSVGVSLIIGGWGFLQLFGMFQSVQSGSRLDASFGNASYLAIYMLFHVFITTYLLTKHQGSKLIKWFYGLIIAFQAFILIFTQTRGSILALFGSVFLSFLLIAIFEKENIKLKKTSIGILVGLVALGGIFFFTKDTELVQKIQPLKRLSTISLTERTTISRFLIWDMAYQGFREKPILGWGQENFVFVFEKYYSPKMYAQEPWFDRAHNIFFDWLIAGGVLGLLAYLSIFLFAFHSLWKSSSLSVLQKSLFASLLVGYFFHNLFVFDNIASYILFVLILSLIHFKSTIPDDREADYHSKIFAYEKIITLIIIVLTIFAVYFFNVKGILANKTLLRAISQSEERLTKNLEYFKKALSYDTYGNQEIREQLLNAASTAVGLNIDSNIKEEFVSLAREEMQKQIDSNPISARHQVFMGSFLNRLRLYDEARSYLEKALELSPKKQLTYFEFVTNYLNAGEANRAYEFAKKAYELEPEFNTARIIYAAIAIYNNQTDLAQNLLEEKFENKFYGDERLARAYFDTGQIGNSILTWQEAIKENPNNTQYRISLSATYLAADLRAEAINEIQKAIEIDPNFKEQGEFFIREIHAGRNP